MARRTDVSRFLDAVPDLVETPDDRRSRIQGALERAAATAGSIRESAAENERMYKIHRLAKSDMALDMRDLMGGLGALPPAELFPEERAGMSMRPGHEFLTEQFPTNHDNVIMEEMYNNPRPQQRPKTRPPAQRQSLMETLSSRPRQPQAQAKPQNTPGWTVKRYLGETRGGDTVPVWKVQNQKTGATVDKIFRLENVAGRVASLLNESNNQYDPRVVSVIMDYDKRDKLLKEARLLEKSATDEKPMKMSRLKVIRAEIASLDYKLSI